MDGGREEDGPVYATLTSDKYKAAPRRVRLVRARLPQKIFRFDPSHTAMGNYFLSNDNIFVEVFNRAGNKVTSAEWVCRDQLSPRKHNEDQIAVWFVLQRLKGNI